MADCRQLYRANGQINNATQSNREISAKDEGTLHWSGTIRLAITASIGFWALIVYIGWIVTK